MILASQSPRRLQILHEAGFTPEIEPADIDETRKPDEAPRDLVRRLATGKAQVIADKYPNELILAADTIVWLADGEVLSKPHDAKHAKAMLHKLSGVTHFVSSGACVIDQKSHYEKNLVDTAQVTFYPLSDTEIDAYVASMEPFDKAGGYGVQGIGRLLIQNIEGDFYTIMGLPITLVVRELLAPVAPSTMLEDLLKGTTVCL